MWEASKKRWSASASEITAVGTGSQAEAGSSVQLAGNPTLNCGTSMTACLNVHNNTTGVVSSSAVPNILGVTISNNLTGMKVFYGSSLALFSSVVDNNSGNEIQISDSSSMTLGSTSIQLSRSKGITAGNLVSVSIGNNIPPNNVTGNGGGADVACDASSRVTGTNFLPGLAIS